MYRSPFNVAGGLTVGKPPVLFAGLVIQQMLVTGAASTHDQAIENPPLHLGVVRTAERILALLDTPEAETMAMNVARS